jgi:primase-polymerase (primpol)-like protein
MKPRYDEIPEELRLLRNWVVWKSEKRTNSKGVVSRTKVPYCARNDKHAKSNNPATWSEFGAATEALKRGNYQGIGFCLSEPFVGIDLDGCRPDGGQHLRLLPVLALQERKRSAASGTIAVV